MRRTITALAAGIAVLGFTASSAAAKQSSAAAEPVGNIVETAIAVSSLDGPDTNGKDYDLLIGAVLEAGLADALSGPGPLTVFAPTDRAFQKLVADLTMSDELPSEADTLAAIQGLDDTLLTTILLYHVTPGALDSAAVLGSESLTMLSGGTVTPRFPGFLGDGAEDARDPKLVKQAIDIVATNGYIHTIDRVLLP